MAPQKTKSRRNPSQPQAQHHQHSHSHSQSQSQQLQQAPQTDYDTDQYYPSDVPGSHQYQQQPFPPPPSGPLRTTDDLNLNVLRRYNPSIHSIVAIAPYTVLYVFVPETHKWEKANIEGSLFICALEHDQQSALPGAQRFVAIILNRVGLNNFATLLEKSEDVEITQDFLILQVHGDVTHAGEGEDGEEGHSGLKIYGLWIFSDPGTSTSDTRAQVTAVIKECAATAEKSRAAAEEAMRLVEAASSPRYHQEEEASVAMGRQLSLRELFGQQRERDAGFSVHDHHSPATKPPAPQVQPFYEPPVQPQPQHAPMFVNHPDTDFFRGNSPYRAAMESRVAQSNTSVQSTNDSTPRPNSGGQDLLADLFRKASSQGR